MYDKTAGVWSRFTVKDGLPDAPIECLYQDRHDRMWLGTSDRGVACFDHRTFATFTHQDGLSGNRVHSIVEDAAGRLWLGTNRGLTWYDDEGFHPLAASLSHSFLGGSCADTEGGVWFGLEQHSHSSPALAHWDGQQFRLISLTNRAHSQGESIHALAIDSQGSVWCGGHSLYSYDRTSDMPHRHARFNEEAPNAEVTGLLPRSDGTLWLAPHVGVFVFDREDFRLLEPSRQTHFLALAEAPRSGTVYLTAHRCILACCDGERMDFAYRGDLSFSRGLCVDRLGRVWVGTHDRGLYCYDSQRLQFFGSDHEMPTTDLTRIAQSDTGSLWTSTKGDLVRFPQRSSADKIAIPGCKKITALGLDREGRVWFGGMGLYRYDCDHRRLELMHRPASPDTISAITIDECGRAWFAYQRGAGFGYVEDGQARWFGLAPAQIDVLAWSRQGNLWLGANSADEKHGLYRFDGTTCTKVDAGLDCLIFALCEGTDGRLWVGTNQGLWCLNKGQIQHFTRADGLPCDIITSIIQAQDGRLWMGTEGHGLCGYDDQVFQKVEVPELSLCNTVRDLTEGRDGTFYLATKGGLVRYVPQQIPPQAGIVSLEAEGTYEIVADQTIHLPSTANGVRIHFEGTSALDPPSHLIYRYRLDGLESAWRQTAATHVEYPPLSPGAYAFCLQAVDRDLTYSEQVKVHFSVAEDARLEVLQRSFIGQSPMIRQVEADLLKAAETDLTVLLLGATGTGKSLAAQAIHELSARRDAPFVAVNCGTLGRELINNELFGHEKGAFTGADNRYLGKFEQAHQGTLFLDEIGDLTLDVQANLLEVLQEQQFYRLGGNQVVPVDVRVIAATHDDLEQAVASGTFRADLFYRLEGFPIRIPSLKERPEDIPLLVEYFATHFASQLKQPVAPITPAALEALQAYDWPGNVRQLEHAVQRAVLSAQRDPLEPDHFIQNIDMANPYRREGAFAIVPLEDHLRQYLTRVLNHTNGVIYGPRGAARLLGVHPNTLRSRLRKLGIPFRKRERKRP